GTSTPTTPAPAPIWASCADQPATRSSSTACGRCGSATETPPRPANCSSPPGPTAKPTGCSERSSQPADTLPRRCPPPALHPRRPPGAPDAESPWLCAAASRLAGAPGGGQALVAGARGGSP